MIVGPTILDVVGFVTGLKGYFISYCEIKKQQNLPPEDSTNFSTKYQVVSLALERQLLMCDTFE